MTPPSFNERIVAAVKKEFDEFIDFPIPWSFVDDVAWVSVAAMEKGARGERYIAHGVAEEASGLSKFCNFALEVAGSSHRIRSVGRDKLDEGWVRKKYGDSLTDLGKTSFPTPWSDSSFTQKRLGYKPTPLRVGMPPTLEWMRQVHLI